MRRSSNNNVREEEEEEAGQERHLPSDAVLRSAIQRLVPTVDLKSTGIKAFTKVLAHECGISSATLEPRADFIKQALTDAINALPESSSDERESEIESESDELEENTTGIGKRKTTEFPKKKTTKKQKPTATTVLNKNDNAEGKDTVIMNITSNINATSSTLLINNKEKVQCDEESDSSIDDITESDHNKFSLIMDGEDESDDESDDEESDIGIVGYSKILKIVNRMEKRGSIPFKDQSERRHFHEFLKKNKNNRADGKLNRKKIDLINALNLNFWYKSDGDWDAKYNEMVKFYKKYGRCDSPSLTEWAREQRMQYSVNPRTISSDRIEALNRIPKWDWDVGATAAAKHSSKQTSVSKLRIHSMLLLYI